MTSLGTNASVVWTRHGGKALQLLLTGRDAAWRVAPVGLACEALQRSGTLASDRAISTCRGSKAAFPISTPSASGEAER
jgi:hypothetical protein